MVNRRLTVHPAGAHHAGSEDRMGIPTISWTDYRDRVYGAWLGKSIAGTLGAPFEGWKERFDYAFDPKAVERMLPNDDLDLQVLWLDVLERQGVAVDSDDLAAAFAACCPYSPGEYGYFKRNWARGIHPPASGWFNNRYYIDGMGCPIRSEIWACICPGQPELAARYAGLDGILDHAGDSVHYERWLAAVEADAFVCHDHMAVLRRNLRFLPEGTRARRLVDDVLAWSAAESDWRIVREWILRDYGHPDCTNSHQNLGFTVLALAHGRGEFIATSMLALNCGFDTDCTCATAGAILGITTGGAELQRRHAFPDTTFTLGVRIQRRSDRLDDLADDTCRVGLAVADHHRGIAIAGAPAVPPLPAPRRPAPSIRIDYAGKPVVGPSSPCSFRIVVANPTAEALAGALRLHLPAGWSCDWPGGEVRVPAGGTTAVEMQVRLDPALRLLPEGNLLTARWEAAGGIEHRFGVNGAQVWRVWGPFWENHCRIPAIGLTDRYGDHIAAPEGGSRIDLLRQFHLNTRADLAVDYIGEPPAARRAEAGPGICRDIPEDDVAVGDLVGFQGPCVVYAERIVVSDRERTVGLNIGHTDAFALWLNGERLSGSDAVDWWTAENRHVDGVRLRAGENRLLVRLVRRGADARFSAFFTVHGAFSEHVADLATAW